MSHTLEGKKAKMVGGHIVLRSEKSERNVSKAKSHALAKKGGYDSSTLNAGSYESHKKRLSNAYSSHAAYLANKNK